MQIIYSIGIAILGCIFLVPCMGQPAFPLNVEQIFLRFDHNKDGLLTQNEVPEQFWKNLSRADVNGDGAISKQELEMMRERMQGRFGQTGRQDFKPQGPPVAGQPGQMNVELIFERFDRNKDGLLTQDEVPEQFWKNLSRADVNGDRAISKQELEMILKFFQSQQGRTQSPSQEKIAQPHAGSEHFQNAKNWSAFDASNIGGLETKGYFGTVYDGRYIYYVPSRTFDFHGCVLRYDTTKNFKDARSWESYDAGFTDGMETKGYGGAVFDGRYIYYVPMTLRERQRHSRVLRYDTKGIFTSASSWSAYDAKTITGKEMTGYVGGVFDGNYIYFVPFGYPPYAHALVLRYDPKQDFKSSAAWSVYDAGKTDGLNTKGFYGAAYDGRYIYFVPFSDGSEFHGRVLRYDTKGDFQSSHNWKAYDAGKTDGLTTIGYKGAVFDGRYVYFVPYQDGNKIHGRVLRYDTRENFQSASSWSAFNASSTDNLDTRGYVGAEFDKHRYIYFIPYNDESNKYHARFLRYDTQGDFKNQSSWSAFNACSVDGLTTKGYKFSAYDGKYIYFAPFHNGISFHGFVLRYQPEE